MNTNSLKLDTDGTLIVHIADPVDETYQQGVNSSGEAKVIDATTHTKLDDLITAVEAMSTSYLPLTYVAYGRATGDQTTTSASATNVTNLSFSVGANEIWTFHFNLFGGCSAVNGVKFAITFPTGATVKSKIHSINTGSTTFQSENIGAVSGTLSTNAFWELNSTALNADVFGIVVNGSTAGTLQLQYASATGGDTSTISANSFVVAQRRA